jgi:hypothetical protein
LLLVAVSIPAAQAHRAIGSKTVSRTSYVRWPAVPGRSRYSVLRFTEPNGNIRRGDVYVNGSRVTSPFPSPYDYIVACAHRVPAFASGTLLRATGSVYALVVLTTGECVDGPKVAGMLQRVKVVVTYTPYQR